MKIAVLAAVLAFASCSRVSSTPAPDATAPATPAATATAAPIATTHAEEAWTVRDNGKRCIVAPCPSWTAKNVATGAETEITGVDLDGTGLAGSELSTARERVLSGKAEAKGSIKKVPAAGPGGEGTVLYVVEVTSPAK